MRGLRDFKASLLKTSGNKYGNKKLRCLNGHLHDSTIEANYCLRLKAMLQHKEILAYSTQPRFALEVGGKLICHHIVDFLVVTNDNETQVHEVKGFATPEWMLKKKLFEALKPHIKYIVIKK